MNDTLTQLAQLAGHSPREIFTSVSGLLTITFVLGRAYHALVNGGGLKTICRAIWCGTNTPPAAPTAVPIRNPQGIPLMSLAASLFLAGALTGLVACNTPQTTAYRTVATTQVTVQAAVAEWNAYVRTAHPPIAQEQAVADAYKKYQAAMIVLCDAGAVYSASSQTNSAGATGAAAALQAAVQEVNQAIADLEALIAQLGVQLK